MSSRLGTKLRPRTTALLYFTLLTWWKCGRLATLYLWVHEPFKQYN